MLITLLILVGLAPSQAAHDPCLAPSWAVSSSMGLACDFKDAHASAMTGIGLPSGYIGKRTHVAFRTEAINAGPYKTILTSVGGDGIAHGSHNTWVLDLRKEGVQPTTGSLVELLPDTLG